MAGALTGPRYKCLTANQARTARTRHGVRMVARPYSRQFTSSVFACASSGAPSTATDWREVAQDGLIRPGDGETWAAE
jgi:hypothetical protein